MFSFQCEWLGEPVTGERSGLELGNMTFTGDKGAGSSRGSPHLAMMLGPSLSTLLDGLERLMIGKQLASDFLATVSSFSVSFRRARREMIAIQYQTSVLGEVSDAELHAAIISGLEALLPRGGEELSEDAGREDLVSSLQGFKNLLPSGGTKRS